ncbi:MFS transporter [Granulicella sibirica]|uniref:Putative transporter n=1 Tax=Granulicella sibirica TaxID=2479048 RepID=A0A4Q0SUK7_9BACT|nr:MFS transporter [Granulicella sibirica]RXH54715.1 putative transporter [Granulicella sibirica]
MSAAGVPLSTSDEPDFSEDASVASAPRRIGAILLGEGITPGNVFSYVYVGIATICIITFFPLMQPYVLVDHLGLSREHLGQTVGQLSFIQNMAVFCFVTIFGTIADHVRCNRFVALSCLIITVAAILYPLSTSLASARAIIFLLGIGQVANNVALVATTMSYPDNRSRGKYASLISLCMIGGVTLFSGQFASRLPLLLKHAGYGPNQMVRYAFWVVALLGLPAIALSMFGLKQDVRKPSSGSIHLGTQFKTLATNFTEVFRHARRQPRFQMVLFAALVTRSDYAVVTTYLSLWVIASGHRHNIDTATAMKHVGAMYTCMQVATISGTMATGWLLDKFNRTILLVASLTAVTGALLSPLLVKDVFAMGGYLVVVVIGLTEGALSSSMSTVMAQEAPSGIRGSTVGIVNLIGIVSVAFINYAGGVVFDRWSYAAPFALMAALNILVLSRVIPFLRHR